MVIDGEGVESDHRNTTGSGAGAGAGAGGEVLGEFGGGQHGGGVVSVSMNAIRVGVVGSMGR
ncbi:hypothetical protein MMRN_29480 [Mycobacterium marinum]|nr:hypothetical protein MMRN_29480 [Mycobacterium marinum]